MQHACCVLVQALLVQHVQGEAIPIKAFISSPHCSCCLCLCLCRSSSAHCLSCFNCHACQKLELLHCDQQQCVVVSGNNLGWYVCVGCLCACCVCACVCVCMCVCTCIQRIYITTCVCITQALSAYTVKWLFLRISVSSAAGSLLTMVLCGPL